MAVTGRAYHHRHENQPADYLMLTVHRGSRGDVLLDGLGALLRHPPEDPFAPEVVAVPTRGVERWITQRLSELLGTSPGRADGVCANIEFPFPGRLVDRCAAAATGSDPDSDPWVPERLVWHLLDVVDASLAAPELATLAAHLGVEGGLPGDSGNPRWTRRFAAVRHLADLFDRYGIHRPAMLQAWARGEDSDGSTTALGTDLAWQAWLWRRLVAEVGIPSPAQRLPEVCQRLREDPSAAGDLPERLSLFGLTRLPPAHLEVLVALAEQRDVHLWLLHPSPALWSSLATESGASLATVAGGPGRPSRRVPRDAAGALEAHHRLLRTWGRDARELQLLLSEEPALGDDALAEPLASASLLGAIQADIRADRPPPGPPMDGGEDRRITLAPGDVSVQVHGCHGRARQVEVLRDAIAHLLCNDPTLEPRDVVVMCPDIDVFAPLIQATFGAGAHITRRDLHVRLADRAIRQTNPLFGAVTQLLVMASGRVRASEVLDLADTPPVRRRFGFDDDDLSRIAEWSRDAGVRWGVDATSRAQFKMTTVPEGTWRAGMDRLLLGVAMSEDGLRRFGDVLPLDDVDSGDVDLVGRFAELIDRLSTVLGDLRRSGPLHSWLDTLSSAADLLTATTPADGWQRLQFNQMIDDVRLEAGTGGTKLTLPEVQALFTDRLRGRPTRANFRTGHITMCTLVPMRSVPHRVVCLLGLDDGLFPRQSEPDGDDIIARNPFVGDPDPRSEDRQLLLDALLAAQDHLVISYTARDERTNASRPPAVPLGELLETIERSARPGPGALPVMDQVVVHHPLQPFASSNFTAGELVESQSWSFDTSALAGAVAARQRDAGRVGRLGSGRRDSLALGTPLPAAPRDPVELSELLRFVQHPVRAFLRQRLGISLYGDEREPSDGLPLDLGGLDKWAIGDRLLRALLDGIDPLTACAAERARGELPPGALGQWLLDELLPEVKALVAASRDRGADEKLPEPAPEASPTGHTGSSLPAHPSLPAAPSLRGAPSQRSGHSAPTAIDVNALLPDGRYVVGTVGPLEGNRLQTVTWSRLGPKHRLAAWVRLLAVTATEPDREWHARSIGRSSGARDRIDVAEIAALGPDCATRLARAQTWLADLVALYDEGLCEPLPFACATAAAWADARRRGKDPALAARDKWETSNRDFPGEDLDVEHQFVYGGTCAWEELSAVQPGPGESGDGWSSGEPTRLGRLSRRLWDGLLDSEERR
jgi:exodeoxyribonuclease V gamma subunit